MVLLGRKLHANAEEDSSGLVDPPKVEDDKHNLGAVPGGLSTDSDVAKRYIYMIRSGFIDLFVGS